jgi:hypothetical protein
VAQKNFHAMAPREYVIISTVLALFAGGGILFVTRDLVMSVIVAGSVFVVVILVLAMLILAMTPNETPEGERDKPPTGND